MSQVHPQARTTPRTRAEIHSCQASLAELAQRYNVTVATVRKVSIHPLPKAERLR